MTTQIKRTTLALAGLGLSFGFVAVVPSLSASAEPGGRTDCSPEAVETYTAQVEAWTVKVEKRTAKVEKLAAKVKDEKSDLRAAKVRDAGDKRVAAERADVREAKAKLASAKSKGNGSLQAAEKQLAKVQAKLDACAGSPTVPPTAD